MKVQNVLQNSPYFSGKVILAPGLSKTEGFITESVEAAMGAAPKDTVLSIYDSGFPNVLGIGFKPREAGDVFYSHSFAFKDSPSDKTMLNVIADGLKTLTLVKNHK